MAVAVAVRAASMTLGDHRPAGQAGASAASTHRTSQTFSVLHRDPRAGGSHVVVDDREDQVAELAEAGVGAELASCPR